MRSGVHWIQVREELAKKEPAALDIGTALAAELVKHKATGSTGRLCRLVKPMSEV